MSDEEQVLRAIHSRYVVFGDVHLADRPPAMRVAGYSEQILEKVRYVMERAVELKADAVIITGDLFHRKVPSHNSHRLVQALRDALTVPVAFAMFAPFMPVYVVAGNHDESADGSLVGQPLGSLLSRSGHIMPLHGETPDDPNLFGMSWLPEFSGTQSEITAALRDELENYPGPCPPLMFMHAPIVLEEHPFGPEERGWVTAGDLIEVLPETVRLVIAGHIHSGHEAVWVGRDDPDPRGDAIRYENGTIFANPGALSRGSIAESDRERTPQFAIVEYDPRQGFPTVTYEVIPCEPPERVFLLEEYAEVLARAGIGSALAVAFQSAYMEAVTPESLLASLDRVQRPDEIDATTWTQAVAMVRATFDGGMQ